MNVYYGIFFQFFLLCAWVSCCPCAFHFVFAMDRHLILHDICNVILVIEHKLYIVKTSLFICLLYFEGSPLAKDPKGVLWWRRSCYISMFPCSQEKIFWWDKSGNFKKTRRKECRKEKEEIAMLFKKTRKKECRKKKEEITILFLKNKKERV